MKYAEKCGVSAQAENTIIYLLGALRWKCSVPGSPVQMVLQPSESAYRGGTEPDTGHASRNPKLGMTGLWHCLRQRDYARRLESLSRVMRKLRVFPKPNTKKSYKRKPYEQINYLGQRIKVDVKGVLAALYRRPRAVFVPLMSLLIYNFWTTIRSSPPMLVQIF